MLYNQGTWDNLPKQCNNCMNLKISSLRMEQSSTTYACGKYLLTDPNKKCPKFIKKNIILIKKISKK